MQALTFEEFISIILMNKKLDIRPMIALEGERRMVRKNVDKANA